MNKDWEAKAKQLEAQLAAANETIADLRDYNDRAPKIAAEEANRQRAEIEARLREASLYGSQNDPEFDATEAAHPAWWRGHDHVAAMFKQKVERLQKELAETVRQRDEWVDWCKAAEARAEALRAALEAAMSEWKRDSGGMPEYNAVWRQCEAALRADEQPAAAESEGE